MPNTPNDQPEAPKPDDQYVADLIQQHQTSESLCPTETAVPSSPELREIGWTHGMPPEPEEPEGGYLPGDGNNDTIDRFLR